MIEIDIEKWDALSRNWGVVEDALRRKAEGLHAACMSRERTATIEDLRFIQGQIEAYRGLLNLPKAEIAELRRKLPDARSR